MAEKNNKSSNVFPNPTVSTVFLLKSTLSTIVRLKIELQKTLEYRNLISKNNKEELRKMCIRETGSYCLVYSKSANNYYNAWVCLNKDNKIDVYTANVMRTPGKIYANIDLRTNIVNLRNNSNIKENNNNIIFYNGEKVKVVIVSEKKYNAIDEKTK
jgi:hypothetical protein